MTRGNLGHVVLYHSNGETRQEYEVIFAGEPVSGEPAANDEAASAVGLYSRAESGQSPVQDVVDAAPPGRGWLVDGDFRETCPGE